MVSVNTLLGKKAMNNVNINIVAMLPLLGVIVGAILQHFLSRTNEKKKQYDTLKTQAYIDYLKAVSKFAQAAKTDPNTRMQLISEAADAKARICVYGSKLAIEKLASFEDNGPVLSEQKSLDIFIELCSIMRDESATTQEAVSSQDIELVLFGKQQRSR